MPIASSALIKKYIVQTRRKSSGWQEVAAFRSLEKAKDKLQQLKRQDPTKEVRIFNRLTGQVMKL